MRGSIAVTTTTPVELDIGDSWSRGLLYNNSDTVIYVQITPETDALTTSNGLPLDPGEYLPVAFPGVSDVPIMAIHGGTSGTRELRYVFWE